MIGQINIFEISRPKYKIKKPIRLIELKKSMEKLLSKAIIIKIGNMFYQIRKLTPKECWRLMGWIV